MMTKAPKVVAYEEIVCGEDLVMQRYGGGLRYYCPSCDSDLYTIRWTNGSPPQDRRCSKTIRKPKIFHDV